MAGYLSKEFSGLGIKDPLNINHYQAVRKTLWTVKPQWHNIGLALGIPVFKLNEFSGSLEKKMDQMIEVWLNHTYSTPTWGALMTALRDNLVEGGKPLAAEIEANYIGGGQSERVGQSGVVSSPDIQRGEKAGVRESDNSSAEKPSDEISRADLDFGEQVGEGTVYRGTWTPKGTIESKEVAIKRVVKIDKDTKREVKVLCRLKHPNIIVFYGASTTPPDYFIVTEYAENGSLHDYMYTDPKNRPDHHSVLLWATEIAQGVDYLHVNSILHRDLKPSNVLLTNDWKTAKICDFGTAKITDYTGTQTQTSSVGTILYMAPEVLGGNYSKKCDVFSYGMILWEMLSCKHPFGGNAIDAPQKIKTGERPEIPRDCEQYLAVLIGRCWDGNPENRPTFEEILYVLQERDTSQLRPKVSRVRTDAGDSGRNQGDSSSSPPVPESGQSSVGGMGMRLVGGGYTPLNERDYHIEDRRPSLLVLLKFPTERGNINIPQRIVTYTDFGTFLLNDETGAIVDGIAQEHRGNVDNINKDILKKWLQGRGKQPATWGTLIEVLRDSQLTQLANDIERNLSRLT